MYLLNSRNLPRLKISGNILIVANNFHNKDNTNEKQNKQLCINYRIFNTNIYLCTITMLMTSCVTVAYQQRER